MERPLTKDCFKVFDGSHKAALPRSPILKDNSFVSGVVEDILTISHVEEVSLEQVNSWTCWIVGGKKSRSRRNKDGENFTLVINSKKGAKADSKPSKGNLGLPKNDSVAMKNGDVGSSPSSTSRPYN